MVRVFSRIGEIVDFAVDADIIEKSGSWFSYNGERLGQGRDKVKALLSHNAVLREEIATKVKQHSAELLDKSRAKVSINKIDQPEVVQTTAARVGANIDIEADESDFD